MEKEGGMVQTSHSFARKLASSDKKTREKGVSLLVLWLTCQQEVGEDELKKIWKGLFYCVWHADKAPIQADLIDRLAGILESLDLELSLKFFKVFLSTMRREWGGIDRLRMDKFYLLLRQFMERVFVVLKKHQWDDDTVRKFMDALVERALLATDEFPALGINLHFADIFLDELRKFQPISTDTLGLLLQPFYSTLAAATDKTLLKRVRERVFNVLLDDAKSLCDGKEGETFGALVLGLPMSASLLELASSASTPQTNRKFLYELYDDFSKLDKCLAVTPKAPASVKTDGGLNADSGPSSESSGEGGCGHTRVLRNSGKKIQEDRTGLDTNGKAEVVSGSGSGGKKRKAREAVVGQKKLVKESPCRQNPKRTPSPKTGKVKEHGIGADEGQLVVVGSTDQQEREENGKHKVPEESGREGGRKEGDGSVTETILGRTRGSSSEKKRKEKVASRRVQGQSSKQKKSDSIAELLDNGLSQEVQIEVEVNTYMEATAVANGSERDLGLSGADQDESQDAFGVRDGELDIGLNDSVISNLEKKFASIAANGSPEPTSKGSPALGPSPLNTGSKRKRKRGKKGDESDSQSDVSCSTGLSQHSTSPKSNGDDQVVGSNSVKKKKKVRFSLKNNLVWKPHGPLPPLSMRTPPAATPRGSALKKGVSPGPIRTTPLRFRGAPRRRSPKQTMSVQKPSRSPKSLLKGPRFARRLRKSAGSL